MKIFELDYLENTELTDDDLYHLFECKSLSHSLIVGMFKFAGYRKYTTDKIINMIHKDNKWIYKHFWKKSKRNQFENKLIKIFKNVYWISDDMAIKRAQNWMIIYGLSVYGNNINE